jgi:hypothetical protein
MVKSHFSRRARFFMVTDTNTEDGFDAYPCEVPARTITRVNAIKDIIDRMYDSFDLNPAPEECTQKEADLLTELLDEIFGGATDGEE